MLERARGCLEHNGLRLLRLRSETTKKQRLHYAFWSHGAGDIELPGWWADLLSRSSQEEKEKIGSFADTTRKYLRAGFKGGHFLDFLYPAGAQSYLHKIATRNAARRNTQSRKLEQASGFSSHAQVHAKLDPDESHLFDLVGDLVQDRELEDHKHDSVDSSRSIQPPTHEMGNSETLTFEDRMERLYNSFKRFQTSLDFYDRTILTAEMVDPLLNSADFRAEALEAATKAVQEGDILRDIMEDLILDYLHDRKAISNWVVRDWIVAFRIYVRKGDVTSSRFAKAFNSCLEAGFADKVIPHVIKYIVLGAQWVGPHRYQMCHELCSRYTAWTKDAFQRNSAAQKAFWDHAVTSGRGRSTPIGHLRSFFDELAENMPPVQNSVLASEEIADTFIGLAKVIIRDQTFDKLGSYPVLNFFNQLLRIVNTGPATYDAVNSLLKTVLFVPLSGLQRRYADLHASRLMDAMEVHGGYRGETSHKLPDLARKLFFHLTRADLAVEAQKVMANLQKRAKDQPSDYARLQFQLSKKGDLDAVAKQEVALASAEGRLYQKDPELQAKLRVPPMNLYKTRLETHRRRNETDAMLNVLEEMRKDSRVELDNYVYCLLISGFARTGDLEGADAMFQEMTKSGIKPSIHAYAPILQALAREGDTDAIQDITKIMEINGIEINDWVINAHVYAFLQRGELTTAEALIWRALTFKLESRTKMWNYVILHWALRGNRTKVNLLMHRMRVNKIPRDAFTYACRMQLCLVRNNPRRAWRILHTTMPRLGLQPLPFHYAMVIRGFAQQERKGAKSEIPEIYADMLQKGLHPDWNVKAALSDALVSWNRIRTARQTINRMKLLATEANRRQTGSSPLIMSKDAADQYEVFAAGMFDFAFRISHRSGWLDRFDDIWKTFVDFTQNAGPKPFNPPIRILCRLMNLFRQQRAWTEVRQCWQIALEKAEELADTKGGRLSVASRRSILTRPLYIYMHCLHDQTVPIQEIKELIADILKRGFVLDNRCWNLYIRLLCVSGPQHHFLALETAEEQVVHGMTYYPPVYDVKVPDTKAKILGMKLDDRLRSVFSTRYFGTPHLPFRMETSIGLGLSASSLDDDRSTGWRQILDNTKTWSEVETQAQGPALPRTILESSQQQTELGEETERLGGGTEPLGKERSSSADLLSKLDRGEPEPRPGLVEVTAYLHEGTLLRRPEYTTLVYLAGAYVEWRRRLAFDPNGPDLLREIHRKAPRVMRMIMRLPRIDDSLQKSVLRHR